MPQLTQVAWDFQNYQFVWSILEKVGTEVRILVDNLPIGSATKEITYDGKIEFEDMMGSDRQAQDTTDGVGTYEANVVLEKWGADFLEETIAELDGHGIGTVRFNIGCIAYKNGIDPKPDLISLARVANPSHAFKSGKDALSVSFGLKPHRVYVRGKDLFGNKIT